MTEVRKAAVAGSWYPKSAQALRQAVSDHLFRARAVDQPGFERPVAVIAPHAGLIYSGGVAAYAYEAVRDGSFDLVVLVGPSHFVNFDGVSIWPDGAFETPLGALEIDEPCAAAILTGVPGV